MSSTQLTRRLHQHRMWVNGQLLDAAGKLSSAQLQQAFAIGQGSIWKSLMHMYAAEYVWLGALHGNEQSLAPGDVPGKLPGNQEGEGGIRSLDELRKKWTELDGRWQAYLDELSPERLDDVVHKISSKGPRYAFRRSDILIHVCTHAHYTAAQVVNMLRHAGAETLPDPMLITLARSEAPLS